VQTTDLYLNHLTKTGYKKSSAFQSKQSLSDLYQNIDLSNTTNASYDIDILHSSLKVYISTALLWRKTKRAYEASLRGSRGDEIKRSSSVDQI